MQVDSEGHLIISFNQWTKRYGGSGPVVLYRIERQQHGSDVWETVFDISHVDSVNVAKSGITGLLSDTYYRFRVVPLVDDDGQYIDGIPSKPSEFIHKQGTCG